MKKYLITGGAGFIGSHLCEELKNCDLYIVDTNAQNIFKNILENKSLNHKNIEVHNVDASLLDTIFDCDGIFHLAAQTSVQKSISDFGDSTRNNMMSSINILGLASEKKIPVVFASSAAVYKASDNSVSENNSNLGPISPYAVDKLATEMYGRVLDKVLSLRFFNVYGERQDPTSEYSGVISKFIDRAAKKLPLQICGEGNQTRDFIYVKDVVKCLQKSMRFSAIGGTVNVCTGRRTSISELAMRVNFLSDNFGNVEYTPAREGEVQHSCGDTNRFRKYFDFSPVSLLTGLERTIKGEIEVALSFLPK